MEQTTLSALLRKTRSVAKAVALPLMLAATAATVSLLDSQTAKAAIVTASYNCTFFAIGGTDCIAWQHGDKLVDNFGFAVNAIPTTEPIDVNVQYSWVYDDVDPLNYAGDQWKVEVSAPTGLSFLPTFDIDIFYDVTIVEGPGTDSNGIDFDGRGWSFDSFQIGQTATFDRTITAKTVEPGGAELTCDTTFLGGTDCSGAVFIPGQVTKVTVTDNIQVTENALLTSVQNSWTQKKISKVPGPLPILGAGVAFGFSRKLRRRITTAKAV